MPSPADSDGVISALRLGWYVAEVRGRNRPDAPRPESGFTAANEVHVLPLRNERGEEDLRIEAQVVMSALAGRFAVDTDQSGGSVGECSRDHHRRTSGQVEEFVSGHTRPVPIGPVFGSGGWGNHLLANQARYRAKEDARDRCPGDTATIIDDHCVGIGASTPGAAVDWPSETTGLVGTMGTGRGRIEAVSARVGRTGLTRTGAANSRLPRC